MDYFHDKSVNRLFHEISNKCEKSPNNSPKHKDSLFIIINNTENKQILTFERLNQWFFLLYLKNDWNDKSIIKVVGS